MSDVEAKRALRDYLNNHGWVAYPREMMFMGFCDVAGYLDKEFYAFEIKQKGDTVSKALKQLKDYSSGVHYCVVVVDSITEKMANRFKERGYGVWVRQNGHSEEYRRLVRPESQDPSPRQIDYTASKFERECGKRFRVLHDAFFPNATADTIAMIFDISQKTIEEFL